MKREKHPNLAECFFRIQYVEAIKKIIKICLQLQKILKYVSKCRKYLKSKLRCTFLYPLILSSRIWYTYRQYYISKLFMNENCYRQISTFQNNFSLNVIDIVIVHLLEFRQWNLPKTWLSGNFPFYTTITYRSVITSWKHIHTQCNKHLHRNLKAVQITEFLFTWHEGNPIYWIR